MSGTDAGPPRLKLTDVAAFDLAAQLAGMHLEQIHRLELVASEGHMSTEREVETPLPCG